MNGNSECCMEWALFLLCSYFLTTIVGGPHPKTGLRSQVSKYININSTPIGDLLTVTYLNYFINIIGSI